MTQLSCNGCDVTTKMRGWILSSADLQASLDDTSFY